MKKDNLVFIHKLLKAIATSIISIFIPLYILKITNDIRLSMGYLIFYSLFVMFFMVIFRKFIERNGILAIVIHFIPIIIAEAILSFITLNLYTVIIVSIFMAISQAFYSVPLNIVFATLDKKTNVGKFEISTNVGKIIFTLISGMTISYNANKSFPILCLISTIIYIASSIPLLMCYKEMKEKFIEFINLSCEKKIIIDKKFSLFHTFFGVFQPIMDNVIPQFLYVNSLSFSAVTIVIVLIEILKLLSNYISQKLVALHKTKLMIVVSFVLFLCSSIGMIFIKNNLILYILSCTCTISFPLTFVPLFGIYCKYLKKENNILDGQFMRDINIFSFRPLLYSLSLIGFGFIPSIIAGILAVPCMLIEEFKIIKEYHGEC